MENWVPIPLFQGYSISDQGNVRADKSGRILAVCENQSGVVQVGMMRDGIQRNRSVALMVAKAFLPEPTGAFDTPINLDGDRYNNRVENLEWRPRWFAVKFNRQFRYSSEYSIDSPIINLKTREICENSLACVKRYGLLERDLYFAIRNQTYAWPLYQKFEIVED